jgi:hypothetical protein
LIEKIEFIVYKIEIFKNLAILKLKLSKYKIILIRKIILIVCSDQFIYIYYYKLKIIYNFQFIYKINN